MAQKYLLAISIALLLALSACLKDEPFKQVYHGLAPQHLADGWEISTPENEQMDKALLEAAYKLVYQDERYVRARSLLVIRHGKLVTEAYPIDPADITEINNMQSCTKSFTSILTGIALQRKDLDSLDQKLSDIYPEYFSNYPEKKNISIRHALSMRVGLEFDNSEHTEKLYHAQSSSIGFVISQQKLYEPGIVFHYNDGAPQLISGAIQQKSGKSLSEYAREFLFDLLDISDWKWEQGEDGVTFGAFSLYLTPRDMAKTGQLLLQNGRWKNQQIVDSSWIKQATTIQGTGNFSGASYGFYFWIYPSYGGYAAEGHGGQMIFVIPEKDLVVVYTAWPYTDGDFWDEYTGYMDLIIQSCN